LNTITLGNNPITTVDAGVFQLSHDQTYIGLKNNELYTADLLMFSGISGYLTVKLSDSPQLKILTVMVPEAAGMPKEGTIYVENTGLERITYQIGQLLNRTSLTLVLSNDHNLECEDLDWMAPLVLCPGGRVTVTDVTCADQNHKPLEEFLRSIAPYLCTTATPSNGAWSRTKVSGAGMAILAAISLTKGLQYLMYAT